MTTYIAYVEVSAYADDADTVDAFEFDARSLGVEVANAHVVGRSATRTRVAFDATTRDATRLMRTLHLRLTRA